MRFEGKVARITVSKAVAERLFAESNSASIRVCNTLNWRKAVFDEREGD
jgi:hypothetical protein